MTVGERIREIRLSKDMTLKELSERADISISFISDIENGRSNPSLERLKDIANALDTSISYLLSEEPIKFETKKNSVQTNVTIKNNGTSIHLPLYKSIKNEKSLYDDENIEGYFYFPSYLFDEGQYFLYRADDNSMNGCKINESNIVLIKKQDIMENDGDIMIFIYQGQASIRRFYRYENGLILQAENKDYKPIFLAGNEVKKIKIIGKILWVISDIN